MQSAANEPITYNVREATRVSGLPRSTLYRKHADGKLPFRKCGRRSLILASDLRALLESLPTK